ncbi:MAG TPA: YggS family pyridoxal phosphate-dependent enzyme [Steroidobacteraceae bacterium]|jgi:PLP dependent protein|nr:YggS family pyridoxal phosphate-dependent enzyme [Steroidobacteraceae bacterium]
MLIGPQISPTDQVIANNLQVLRAEIADAAAAAHRSDDCITLVAVSKGHGAGPVRAAAACGVTDFGESYLQEALPKIDALRDLPLSWHFIGRIQANKSAAIAENFDWVHSVDRLKIAERLSAQRPHYAQPLQLCIQVNIAAERAKAGVEPAAAAALAQAVVALPRLKLRGLMCILPPGQRAQLNRDTFHALQLLLQQLNAEGLGLDTLSMGMSADFRDAIGQGATLIRVGTAIFGPRPAADLG